MVNCASVVLCGLTGDNIEQVRNLNPRWRRQSLWQFTWRYRAVYLYTYTYNTCIPIIVVLCCLTGDNIEQVPDWEARNLNPRWRWQSLWQSTWQHGQRHLCLKGNVQLLLIHFALIRP